MHNTEDFIYIINSQGTSWIELTNNGKIDIYSKDSISIHSENDFNFKANRDINIEASGNINIKSKEQLRMESGNASHWKIGTQTTKKDPAERSNISNTDADGNLIYNSYEDLPDIEETDSHLFIDIARDLNVKVGTHEKKGDIKIEVSNDGSLTVKNNLFIHSNNNTHIKTDNEFRVFANSNATIKASTNYFTASGSNHLVAQSKNFITASSTNEYNAPKNNMSLLQFFGSGSATGSSGPTAETGSLPELAHHAWIPLRIPTHEPYSSHENMNPLEFKPNKTDSTLSINDSSSFSVKTEQKEIDYVVTLDTFAKGDATKG